MSSTLVGWWRLVAMEQRYDDGRVVRPFGDAPEGCLYYGADGFLSTAVQRSSRPPFATGGQWTAAVEEKAAAYDGYLTYCGRYEVEGDDVVHHIEHSLFPDWVGTRQTRTFVLDEPWLTLEAQLEPETSEARRAVVRWRREAA